MRIVLRISYILLSLKKPFTPLWESDRKSLLTDLRNPLSNTGSRNIGVSVMPVQLLCNGLIREAARLLAEISTILYS